MYYEVTWLTWVVLAAQCVLALALVVWFDRNYGEKMLENYAKEKEKSK